MASWLIRIVSSSGKSIGKRRAICSGLHALAHRRFCRWPSRRFFQDTAGPVTGMPLGATTMPANLSSTYVRKVALSASLVGLGRRADRSACHWAVVARYSSPPLRVAALRRNSREIVEADRPSRRPISCMEWPCTWRSAISSRSTNERYRPESGFAEGLNIAGGMPPAFRNHLVPTGCDTPASTAASSLLSPAAIPNQNRLCSSRPAAGGRPGDGNGARPDRSDRRFRMPIATSNSLVLRRPLGSGAIPIGRCGADRKERLLRQVFHHPNGAGLKRVDGLQVLGIDGKLPSHSDLPTLFNGTAVPANKLV